MPCPEKSKENHLLFFFFFLYVDCERRLFSFLEESYRPGRSCCPTLLCVAQIKLMNLLCLSFFFFFFIVHLFCF